MLGMGWNMVAAVDGRAAGASRAKLNGSPAAAADAPNI